MAHFDGTRRKLEQKYGKITDAAWLFLLQESSALSDPTVDETDIEDTARTWLKFQELNTAPIARKPIRKKRENKNRGYYRNVQIKLQGLADIFGIPFVSDCDGIAVVTSNNYNDDLNPKQKAASWNNLYPDKAGNVRNLRHRLSRHNKNGRNTELLRAHRELHAHWDEYAAPPLTKPFSPELYDFCKRNFGLSKEDIDKYI